MNVGTDLQAAAQFIDDHGWCQGSVINARGNVCAVGAITCVIDRNADRRDAARDFLINYIREVGYPGAGDHRYCYSISGWNDVNTQDQLTVTSTMRAAAALWFAQNQPSVAPSKDEALPATEAIA